MQNGVCEGGWALGLDCRRCGQTALQFADANAGVGPIAAPVVGRFVFRCAWCAAEQEGDAGQLKRLRAPARAPSIVAA